MTGTGCNTFCAVLVFEIAQNENTKQTCERTCFVLCRCSPDYDVSFPYYRVPSRGVPSEVRNILNVQYPEDGFLSGSALSDDTRRTGNLYE